MSHAEYTHWQAINKRIEFFSDSFCKHFRELQSGAVRNNKTNDLKEELQSFFEKLKNFKEQTKYEEIKKIIDSFLNKKFLETEKSIENFIKDPIVEQIQSTRDDYINSFSYLIFLLDNLASKISLVYFDKNILIKRQVELAFAHLQRILVVDDQVKKIWSSPKIGKDGKKKAKKETYYEKLGAIHLLHHKIWAFKINTEGERTDLALQDELAQDDMLYKSADGLVLTEWKVAEEKDIENTINEAKKQAQRYQRGSLLATELADYCYLVIVSKKSLESIINKLHPLKEDYNFIEEGVKCRIINLAYDRDPPSVEAKKHNKS